MNATPSTSDLDAMRSVAPQQAEQTRSDPAGAFVLGRRPALDGVRALAVLGVVASHAGIPLGGGGSLGVDIFFTLSGFLITTLLLDEVAQHERISLKAFYARRTRRLMPAFLVFLAVSFAITYGGLNGAQRHELIAASLTSLFYFRNWFQIATDTTMAGYNHAHLWSLAVEEQFYFVWPLVMVALTRLRRAATTAGVIGVFVAFVIVSRLVVTDAPLQSRIYLGTDTRATQLLAGAVLAVCLAHFARLRTWLAKYAAVGLPATLAAMVVTMLSISRIDNLTFLHAYYRGGIAAFGALVALFIGFLMFSPNSPITRALSCRPLVLIGAYSYAIYLWHVLVLNLFAPRNVFGRTIVGIESVGARTAVVLVVTIGVAAASMRFVEAPLQRRLFPWANHAKRAAPPAG